MRLLSLSCCAEAVQLTHSCVSGKTALNVAVYLMYAWEGASSISICAILLDPSLFFDSYRILLGTILEIK